METHKKTKYLGEDGHLERRCPGFRKTSDKEIYTASYRRRQLAPSDQSHIIDKKTTIGLRFEFDTDCKRVKKCQIVIDSGSFSIVNL